MASDLQSLVAENQPQYTLSEIRLSLNSQRGRNVIWIIVEGDDDLEIYSPFFNDQIVRVRNSADENNQKGCEHVEEIVRTVLTEDQYESIYGIRDLDYTPFNSSYSRPEHIFVTDCRDIEMQMFDSLGVLGKLTQVSPTITQELVWAKQVARTIGYYRIYNDLYNLGFGFKSFVKQSKIWDELQNDVKPDWEQSLAHVFFVQHSLLNPIPTQEEFRQIIERYRASDDKFICQGHDVVHLLQWKGVVSNLDEKLRDYYTIQEFMSSLLYESMSLEINNMLIWTLNPINQL